MGNQQSNNEKNQKNGIGKLKTIFSSFSLLRNKKSVNQITNTLQLSKQGSKQVFSNFWLNLKNENKDGERSFYQFSDFVIDENDEDNIGEGSFAVVKCALHVPTKRNYAVKIITKKKISEEMKEYVINEPSFLNKLTHQNIIQLIYTHEDDEHIYMFMELLKGGDLFTLIERKGALHEEQAKYIFKQLVDALHYCHQNQISHRDIKLENILIKKSKNFTLRNHHHHENNDVDYNYKVKLIDFGFACNSPQTHLCTDFPGSMLYAAPELLCGTPYNSQLSDVYSLGVVLYVILYGKFPFVSHSNRDLHQIIQTTRPEFDSTLSPVCTDLLCKMLHYDVKQRISISDIMNHAWLNSEKNKLSSPYPSLSSSQSASTLISSTVISPIKSKVHQLKCEVEKHSQNLKRFSPQTTRRHHHNNN